MRACVCVEVGDRTGRRSSHFSPPWSQLASYWGLPYTKSNFFCSFSVPVPFPNPTHCHCLHEKFIHVCNYLCISGSPPPHPFLCVWTSYVEAPFSLGRFNTRHVFRAVHGWMEGGRRRRGAATSAVCGNGGGGGGHSKTEGEKRNDPNSFWQLARSLALSLSRSLAPRPQAAPPSFDGRRNGHGHGGHAVTME